MKKRCLPGCLIARNICLLLLLIASGVVVSAELSAAANQHQDRNVALKKVFVYQILIGAGQL